MKYLSWGGLSELHRMPVTRVATLMPVFGYLILFSQSFPDLLKYADTLGTNYWFSTDTRLKLIYLGGLSLTGSMVLHFLFCPSAPRRYSDEMDLRDKFLRFGSATDVPNAMLESASKSYLFRRQKLELEGLRVYLESYIQLTRGNKADAVLQTDYYKSLVSGIEGDFELDRTKRLELFIVIFGPSVELHKSKMDDWAIREACIKLLEIYFHASNRSRPYILSMALLLAGIGIILILLPAMEMVWLVSQSI